MSEPRFFSSQKEWRAWLEKNHAERDRAARRLPQGRAPATAASPTSRRSTRRSASAGSTRVAAAATTTWTIRFTPRKARSIWSQINIKRIEELKAAGLVHAAGLAAYERRDPKLQKRYSFENRDVDLAPAYEKQFRANKKAWAYFETMPPSYRRPAIWWVMSAKQEETRERRLATLIADSAAGRKIKPLTPPRRRA